MLPPTTSVNAKPESSSVAKVTSSSGAGLLVYKLSTYNVSPEFEDPLWLDSVIWSIADAELSPVKSASGTSKCVHEPPPVSGSRWPRSGQRCAQYYRCASALV